MTKSMITHRLYRYSAGTQPKTTRKKQSRRIRVLLRVRDATRALHTYNSTTPGTQTRDTQKRICVTVRGLLHHCTQHRNTNVQQREVPCTTVDTSLNHRSHGNRIYRILAPFTFRLLPHHTTCFTRSHSTGDHTQRLTRSRRGTNTTQSIDQ